MSRTRFYRNEDIEERFLIIIYLYEESFLIATRVIRGHKWNETEQEKTRISCVLYFITSLLVFFAHVWKFNQLLQILQTN